MLKLLAERREREGTRKGDEGMSTENKRDLAEWDAEIEAEFQRAVAATKKVGQRKRGRRHVGFP